MRCFRTFRRIRSVVRMQWVDTRTSAALPDDQ
jgi:hypothetical protein